MGEGRPDAALVRLPSNFKTAFPIDLPIQITNMSTASYIQNLKRAYTTYQVLSMTGSIYKGVDDKKKLALDSYAQDFQNIQNARNHRPLVLSSSGGFSRIVDVATWWPFLPMPAIDNRQNPGIFGKSDLMTDPSRLSRGEQVFKISTAAVFDKNNEVSVGNGTVTKACNRSYQSLAIECFRTGAGAYRFYRGFEVAPSITKGELIRQKREGSPARNDVNYKGMSGSLVFQSRNHALCGLLSGTPDDDRVKPEFHSGNWLVHHFYDVFRAFDGLLLPGRVKLTLEEATTFIESGKLPDGCGIYEF